MGKRIRKGSITVMLALFLSVLVTLLYAGMRSVQMAAARTQMLCAVDVGLFSLFGQYDRTMLDQYGLFVLDGSSGGQGPAMAAFYESFAHYMESVLEQNTQSLSVQRGGFLRYELLTDRDGETFFSQAVKAERESPQETRPGDRDYAKMREDEALGLEFEEKLRQAMGEGESQDLLTDDSVLTENSDSSADWISEYQELMERPLLEQIGVSVDYSGVFFGGALLSKRDRAEGLYVLDRPGMAVTEESLKDMRAYLCRHLGYFGAMGNNGIHCGLEYVWSGETEDPKNLQKAAEKLLRIREGMLYREEQDAADERALGAIYLHAVTDVSRLFHGGTWETMRYVDYLSLFLRDCGKHELVSRGMDWIEQEVRVNGHPEFCMDACVTAAEMTVEVQANHQKTFQIVKEYRYD